jgi:hypothetical protein
VFASDGGDGNVLAGHIECGRAFSLCCLGVHVGPTRLACVACPVFKNTPLAAANATGPGAFLTPINSLPLAHVQQHPDGKVRR